MGGAEMETKGNSKAKKAKNCSRLPSGQSLNIMAAAYANAVSDGLTIDELNVLALFFAVVSESISLVAASKALESGTPQEEQNLLFPLNL